ncbi:hypothetical protein ACFLXP_01185 [Chloroflexota bacterium]
MKELKKVFLVTNQTIDLLLGKDLAGVRTDISDKYPFVSRY